MQKEKIGCPLRQNWLSHENVSTLATQQKQRFQEQLYGPLSVQTYAIEISVNDTWNIYVDPHTID